MLASDGALFSDNVVTGADVGVLVRAAVVTIRRNTFSGNGVGIQLHDAFGTIDRTVTSNNSSAPRRIAGS